MKAANRDRFAVPLADKKDRAALADKMLLFESEPFDNVRYD
jgi:hypothetical protein